MDHLTRRKYTIYPFFSKLFTYELYYLCTTEVSTDIALLKVEWRKLSCPEEY
jgi:hypothetical protein